MNIFTKRLGTMLFDTVCIVIECVHKQDKHTQIVHWENGQLAGLVFENNSTRAKHVRKRVL